jgi:hypothetical protein
MTQRLLPAAALLKSLDLLKPLRESADKMRKRAHELNALVRDMPSWDRMSTIRVAELLMELARSLDGKEDHTFLQRNINGWINNCALTNGAEEKDCQMCKGCPDKDLMP